MTKTGRFEVGLAALLLAALVARVAYLLAQPGTDPAFAKPILDGAYYVDWAVSLAAGRGGPGGAFYLAPLYPLAFWVFLEIFGDNIALLYLLQHVATVATAGLLALVARHRVGEGAGLAAAGLVLLYHPLLYFPSRPVGEPLALLLLALGVFLFARRGPWLGGLGGVACGLAALARPNLLLVILVWIASAGLGRRWSRAALLLVGALAVILPVTVRNWVVSGHPVLISANAGMTLYHGNGPHAKGIGVLPAGLSGRLEDQQVEATRLASRLSGRPLDAVEADQWWGRLAVEARLDDPLGTARLLGRRLILLFANAELSLDYAPGIDADPWRWAAPLPFAVILGLAAAGVWLAGIRGSGEATVWTAIVACAAAPVLFYASSRYRLPMATLLCVPAGAGLASIVRAPDPARRWTGVAVALACAGLSLLLPTADVVATSEAVALANRAVSWKQLGNPRAAEADLLRALELDAGSAPALFGLGVLRGSEGREAEAQDLYRRVLAVNPASAEAAGNLARSLLLQGRADEAVPILRRALEFRPDHRPCWISLVAALFSMDDVEGAREVARQAAAAGVEIDATRMRELESLRPGSPAEPSPSAAEDQGERNE